MTLNYTNDPKVKEVRLNPGEFFFGSGDIKIQTLLGSCVAITFWHPQMRIGGMCHYLLAHRGSNKKWPKGAFADECIDLFLNEIRKANTIPSEYEIKLFGGSTMFSSKKTVNNRPSSFDISETSNSDLSALDYDDNNISKQNIEIGFSLLKKHNLKIKASDVGGSSHRNIYLELSSGDVWVKRDRT